MALNAPFQMGTPEKTYKTYENAVKALDKVLGSVPESFRYFIVATEEGRFLPLVVLNRDQQYLAGTIAHKGITVTF